MHDQLVKLFKAVFIQQKLNPLTRRHLVGRMLLLNPIPAATFFGKTRAFFQPFEFGLGLFWLLLHFGVRRLDGAFQLQTALILRKAVSSHRTPKKETVWSRSARSTHQLLAWRYSALHLSSHKVSRSCQNPQRRESGKKDPVPPVCPNPNPRSSASHHRKWEA